MFTLWRHFDGYRRCMFVCLPVSIVLLFLCIGDTWRWARRLRECNPQLPDQAVRKLVANRMIGAVSSPVLLFLVALGSLLGETVSVWWKVVYFAALNCAGMAPLVSARVLGVRTVGSAHCLKGPAWRAFGVGLYVVLLMILAVFAILAVVAVKAGAMTGGLVLLGVVALVACVCLRRIWANVTRRHEAC